MGKLSWIKVCRFRRGLGEKDKVFLEGGDTQRITITKSMKLKEMWHIQEQ